MFYFTNWTSEFVQEGNCVRISSTQCWPVLKKTWFIVAKLDIYASVYYIFTSWVRFSSAKSLHLKKCWCVANTLELPHLHHFINGSENIFATSPKTRDIFFSWRCRCVSSGGEWHHILSSNALNFVIFYNVLQRSRWSTSLSHPDNIQIRNMYCFQQIIDIYIARNIMNYILSKWYYIHDNI